MSEQSNVVDQLTEKLRASNVQDGAPSDDWKQKLNLPAKDNRQQTEVRLFNSRRCALRPRVPRIEPAADNPSLPYRM